jgi:hypothetical protein
MILNDIANAKLDVGKATGEICQSQGDVLLNHGSLKVVEGLRETDNVSPEELEMAQVKFAAAMARLEYAMEDLPKAKSQQIAQEVRYQDSLAPQAPRHAIALLHAYESSWHYQWRLFVMRAEQWLRGLG